jgi:hypothetical protein
MNNKTSLLLLPLFLLSACVASPPEEQTSLLNKGAEYKNNVSSLYSVSSITSGQTEFKWKDSNGVTRGLADYSTRPIFLSFGRTTDSASAVQYQILDSVFRMHRDSLLTLGVTLDFTSHSFVTTYNYIASTGWTSQFIADSTHLSQIHFAQMADGELGTPETFVLKPGGTLMVARKGIISFDSLVQDMRSAYKP